MKRGVTDQTRINCAGRNKPSHSWFTCWKRQFHIRTRSRKMTPPPSSSLLYCWYPTGLVSLTRGFWLAQVQVSSPKVSPDWFDVKRSTKRYFDLTWRRTVNASWAVQQSYRWTPKCLLGSFRRELTAPTAQLANRTPPATDPFDVE